MKTKILFLLISLVFLNQQIFAAEFNASVSKNPVSSGETFQVTFSADGTPENFDPPGFKGFDVLSGPNQSQSMQIVNGSMSRSVSYSYYLKAGKPGNYTIGSASAKVDGKNVKTDPISLRVVPMSERQRAEAERAKSQEEKAYKMISDNLWISVSASKKNVYVGEQLTVTYKLYKHPELPITDIQFHKQPELNGFWTKDIRDIQQLDWDTESRNGVRYQTAILKQVVLLPQIAGNLKIDPMELKTVVRLRVQGKRRRSFFDDPFFGNTKDFPYTVKSNSTSINVKSLPEGAPASFNGAVGDLNMEAWLDKTVTKTNEPVTLKIKVSGRGNLELLEAPPLDLPSDLEAYDPRVTDNITTGSSGFSGSRIFEYLLIPRHAGSFEIPPVEFSYFDLGSDQYKTIKSDEFQIEVQKGEGGPSMVTGVEKEELQYLAKDIRFIKSPPKKMRKSGSAFFGSAGFVVLGIMPLLMFIGLIFYRRKKLELQENQALMKNRRAHKIARKRLSEAKKFMGNSEEEKFYEEVSRALWGFISDKLNIPTSDLTKDKARESLNARKVPDEQIDKILGLIDHCEFARYAPAQVSEGMEKYYTEAEKIITVVEDKLR